MEQFFQNVLKLWSEYTILWIVIGKVFIIAFIGFFRSIAQNHQPTYLWNQKEFLTRLISTGNSFALLLTPIFAIFGFLYNLVVWFIYGITSIFDGLIWLILWLWNWFVFICRWVFENIIDPGFFYLVKIIWRYLFVWTWFFIKTSFDHLRITFPFKVYRIAFIGSTITGFIILLCLIFLPVAIPIGIIIGIIITSFFAARILAELHSDYPVTWALNILKKTTTWFFITVGIVAIIAIVNYLVYGSFLQISLFGINMGITSYLGIGLLFFLILFLFSQSMLPAHIYHYHGEIKELSFIREIGKNFLKYTVSSPFTVLPLFILIAIPFIITLSVYKGSEKIKEMTLNVKHESISKNLIEKKMLMSMWLDTAKYTPAFEKESESLSRKIVKKEQRLDEIGILSNPFLQFLLEGRRFYKSSGALGDRIAAIENTIVETDSNIKQTQDQILSEVEEIRNVDSLRSLIPPDGITARKEPIMVGNYKKFGVSSISGTNLYVWKVMEGTPVKEVTRKETKDNVLSITFEKAGNYVMEVYPVNDCGENPTSKYTFSFTVEPRPNSQIVPSPTGPSEVCYGSDVTFVASGGYDDYIFHFPDNVKVLQQSKNSIKVKWGNTAGGVSYSASDRDGLQMTSKTHYVKVSAKPGINITSEPATSDLSEPTLPQEPFFYCTVEEADASINQHTQVRDNLVGKLAQLMNLKARQVVEKHSLTSVMTVNWWFNLKYTIGLILLALVFSSLFAFILMFVMVYLTRYHFFLYSYKREGAFYIVQKYHEYHQKNHNQPLMGLILFPLFIIVLLWLFKFSFFGGILGFLTSFFNGLM